MKRKKLLSTAVAGALVAAQMVMPAMAADTGTINATITDKTAVIKVKVPTALVIAVDQFEMTEDGTQIYSDPFTMENNSAIAVKVDVSSKATLPATTKLVSSKDAAKTSSTEGEAWLAVAAQTADGDYTDGTATTPGALTEANANVASFAVGSTATEATADQTYYLQKASTEAYKLLNAGESATGISYAQFYELTADTSVTDQATANALIAKTDVYVATAAAANGQGLTLVKKGASHTWATGEVYYTAAATPTASIDASKLYVYADGTASTTAGESGKAAFRYIGSLSGADVTWDSTKIGTVQITYTIVGVTKTKYDEVKGDCKYGLYASPDAAPSIATTSYALTADTPVDVTVSLGGGTLAATGISKVTDANGNAVEKGAQWDFANGKLTFTAARANALLSAKVDKVYKVYFNDAAETMVSITLKGSGN